MKTFLLLCLAAAENPDRNTDALVKLGPEAVEGALNAELAKAKKAGDVEHEASIKKHLADYLSERKERIDDAKGGVIHTRQREAIAEGPAAVVAAIESELPEAEKYHDTEHIASLKKHLADYLAERKERIEDEEVGPDNRAHATPAHFDAVEAALKQELAEAEKFHDAQHIASLEKHMADYLDQEESNGNERQETAFQEDLRAGNTHATEAALLGVLKEAVKFGDKEHIRSILDHWKHYNDKFFPTPNGQAPWDYRYDNAANHLGPRGEGLEGVPLNVAADQHRRDTAGEMPAKRQQAAESRREYRLTHGASECHMPLNTQNPLKHAAGCRTDFNYGNWSFVYNALSFGIASMGSAMIYVWLMIGNVAKPFKPALAVNGIVTGIATYHYFRIFNSWNDAFEVFYDASLGRYVVNSAGVPFNDAYRYV